MICVVCRVTSSVIRVEGRTEVRIIHLPTILTRTTLAVIVWAQPSPCSLTAYGINGSGNYDGGLQGMCDMR